MREVTNKSEPNSIGLMTGQVFLQTLEVGVERFSPANLLGRPSESSDNCQCLLSFSAIRRARGDGSHVQRSNRWGSSTGQTTSGAYNRRGSPESQYHRRRSARS